MASPPDPELMMARIPTYAWRAAVMGPAYALATALTLGLLATIGVGDGFAPGDPDPASALARLAVAGAIAGTVLGVISARLALDRTRRWLVLAGTATGLASLPLVQATALVPGITWSELAVMNAGVAVGLAVLAFLAVLLFPPVGRPLPGWQTIGSVLRRRPSGTWAWRIGVAVLAIVAVDAAIALLQGAPVPVLIHLPVAFFEMRLPGTAVLVTVELARALAVAMLAWLLVAALRGSGTRPGPWLAALLVAMAWVPLIEARPGAWTLRLIEGALVGLAALVHAWILAKLLDPAARSGLVP